MKKTLFVVAVAAVLVFAFSGAAFAVGINHSGQESVGTTGAASVVPTAVSDAGIYFSWKPTLGGNAGTNSPHGNYSTTSVKCVVCHAIHYASAAGAPVGSAGQTGGDTLLRMKASDACVFCHATSGTSVNGRPVYDGLGGAIVGPGMTGGNTTTGHITGTNCTYCHTNVHGAGADHSVASLDGYLLKSMTATDVQDLAGVTNNMADAMTAIDNNAVNQGFAAGAALGDTVATFQTVNNSTLRERAVGVFCAECHLGAYATAAAGAATNVYGSSALNGGNGPFSGHRIKAVAQNGTWNGAGDISTGQLTSATVAWAPAANCKACHDALDTFGNAAFPHSWGGTKMWLLSAADAGTAKTALPYGGAPNAYNGPNYPQLSDGVCLKCHVAGGQTEGVGITF